MLVAVQLVNTELFRTNLLNASSNEEQTANAEASQCTFSMKKIYLISHFLIEFNSFLWPPIVENICLMQIYQNRLYRSVISILIFITDAFLPSTFCRNPEGRQLVKKELGGRAFNSCLSFNNTLKYLDEKILFLKKL